MTEFNIVTGAHFSKETPGGAEIASANLKQPDSSPFSQLPDFAKQDLSHLDLKTTKVDFTSSKLSPSAVFDIRHGVEFSAKLFDNVDRKWGLKETLPLHLHESEVSLLLLMSGASKDLIIAGSLHDAFEDYSSADKQQLGQEIERNFGKNVLDLIHSVTEPAKSSAEGNWLERKNAGLKLIQTGTYEEACLSCAAKISTISAGNKFLYEEKSIEAWSKGSLEQNITFFKLLREEYIKKGVPEFLIAQYDFELERFSGWDKNNSFSRNLSAQLKTKLEGLKSKDSNFVSALDVRNAIKLATKFTKNESREVGEDNTLPLHSHGIEVASLLLLAGVKRDYVIAGCLHDVNELDFEKTSKAYDVISKKFGSKVTKIISRMAETTKSHHAASWDARTSAVLQNVETGGTDFASLSCAVKLASVAELADFLHQNPDISEYSMGSLEQNIKFYDDLKDLYVSKGVSDLLVEQFSIELKRLKSYNLSAKPIRVYDYGSDQFGTGVA